MRRKLSQREINEVACQRRCDQSSEKPAHKRRPEADIQEQEKIRYHDLSVCVLETGYWTDLGDWFVWQNAGAQSVGFKEDCDEVDRDC